MALTYEPIFTTTLTSAAAINITSIPQTYTDLVFSAVFQGSTVGENVTFRINNVSGSVYGVNSIIGGNGSVTFSSANNNLTEANIGNSGQGAWSGLLMDIQDYTNTDINRTVQYTLGQLGTTSSNTFIRQGVWSSNNSTALTSLQFGISNNWAAGTSVTMWGIKEA
jgi:hypothetical protein